MDNSLRDDILNYITNLGIYIEKCGLFWTKERLVIKSPEFFYSDLMKLTEIFGFNILSELGVREIKGCKTIIKLDRLYRISSVKQRRSYKRKNYYNGKRIFAYIDSTNLGKKYYTYSPEGDLIRIHSNDENLDIKSNELTFGVIFFGVVDEFKAQYGYKNFSDVEEINTLIIDTVEVSITSMRQKMKQEIKYDIIQNTLWNTLP